MPGGVSVIGPFPFAPPESYWETRLYSSPFDNNCTDGIHWIWMLMGQCAVDARGIAAVVCGFVCLFTWIANGIPQIVENFRTGIPDQALSPFLLLFWSLGDTFNFIGCILTHQLVIQTVISVYSIANDMVLIAQFIYYKIRHQTVVTIVSQALGDGEVHLESNDPGPLEHTTVSDTVSLLGAEDVAPSNPGSTRLPVLYLAVGLLTLSACSFASPFSYSGSFSTGNADSDKPYVFTIPSIPWVSALPLSDPAIFHSPLLPNTSAVIGFTLGCIASVMYLCSRFPQILRNWKRRSTKGLCLGLFLLAIFGNVFYGLQIFLTSLDPLYLLRSLPWLIGSLGAVSLDLFILFQFYYYSDAMASRSSQPSIRHAVGIGHVTD